MNYDEFIKLAVENWKTACDLNWKVQSKDASATMKLSKAINHRTSKASIFESISSSGISQKVCFNFVNEAVLKGDIVAAHGHYRLSQTNVEKMLESEEKKDSKVNVESLKRKFSLRKPRTELSDTIYATPAEELRKIVAKVSNGEEKEIDVQKRKIENLKTLYIGFVKIFDCLEENGYLKNFETFDINELGEPLIKYHDGTAKVIGLPILLEQYEKCYAEAKTEVKK